MYILESNIGDFEFSDTEDLERQLSELFSEDKDPIYLVNLFSIADNGDRLQKSEGEINILQGLADSIHQAYFEEYQDNEQYQEYFDKYQTNEQ